MLETVFPNVFESTFSLTTLFEVELETVLNSLFDVVSLAIIFSETAFVSILFEYISFPN